ncbi:hypothetical protein GCM10010990_03360 [Croceicoccus mobilis]|uniref:HTH crp-type domain-containing protein n=1 Tax=Croceicoccus mobilis TaxID=1703339 RepID=A0A916YSB2_9SPHN|nr:hypothetical protein GCM10010990_03360 [Croceicoccus mobilis]
MQKGLHDDEEGQGRLAPEASVAMATLVRRLHRFSPGADLTPLNHAFQQLRSLDRDEPVWRHKSEDHPVLVLESGFAYSFTLYPDGRRHIGDMFGPGALCGFGSAAVAEEGLNLAFKSGSRVTVFDAARLADALHEKPELELLFKQDGDARARRTAQRNRGLISLPAAEKLALVLLDLREELSLATDPGEWLPLPLTLRELGDLTGLTDVHVSRTLKKLQTDGMLERRGKRFRMGDTAALESALDYRHFYYG